MYENFQLREMIVIHSLSPCLLSFCYSMMLSRASFHVDRNLIKRIKRKSVEIPEVAYSE